MVKRDYWQQASQSYLSRRRLLQAGGLAGLGAAGLALVGCSSSNNKSAARPAVAPTQASSGQSSTAAATQATAARPSGGTATAAGAPTSASTGALASAQGNGKAYSAKPGEKVPVAADTFYTSTNQKKGGTFHYNTQYAGFTAEPNQAYQGDYVILRQVYQGLWQTIGATGALVLYVAGQLEDVDQLTYTVHIRDNVKFHPKPPVNGRTVTADDIKYSYDRLLADKTSTFAIGHGFLDKVEVVDPRTVKFTAKYPFSSRYEYHATMIVPHEAVETFGDLNRKGIGTGPFMLDSEYDPSTTTTLSRHPDFMVSGRPFPDKIEWKHITDQSAQEAAFRSGQLDMIGRNLPKPVADSLKSAGGVAVRQPFFGATYLGIKCDKKPMDDPRVRQALSLAIDRKELLNKLEFGDGSVTGPVSWSLANWALPQDEVDKFYNIANYQANLAQAKQLVASAGGDSLPELELLAPSDLPTQANGNALVAGMLRSAGFKIKENLLPLTTVVRDHLLPSNFDLLIMQTGEVEDPFSWLIAYASKAVPGASGRFGFKDDKVDAAVQAFLAEFDGNRRVQKAQEAQRAILPTYAAQLNLFAGWANTVQKSYLKDFRPGGLVSAYWQFDEWLDKA
jgi:peptide/nickel transport system substrate-binding protein